MSSSDQVSPTINFSVSSVVVSSSLTREKKKDLTVTVVCANPLISNRMESKQVRFDSCQ